MVRPADKRRPADGGESVTDGLYGEPGVGRARAPGTARRGGGRDGKVGLAGGGRVGGAWRVGK